MHELELSVVEFNQSTSVLGDSIDPVESAGMDPREG